MMERHVVDMYDYEWEESHYEEVVESSWIIDLSKYSILHSGFDGQVLTLAVL